MRQGLLYTVILRGGTHFHSSTFELYVAGISDGWQHGSFAQGGRLGGRPLPAVPSHLTTCLEPAPASLAAARPVLQRIRELFPLEEVAVRPGKRTGQSVFGTQEPAAGAENAEEPVAEV